MKTLIYSLPLISFALVQCKHCHYKFENVFEKLYKGLYFGKKQRFVLANVFLIGQLYYVDLSLPSFAFTLTETQQLVEL